MTAVPDNELTVHSVQGSNSAAEIINLRKENETLRNQVQIFDEKIISVSKTLMWLQGAHKHLAADNIKKAETISALHDEDSEKEIADLHFKLKNQQKEIQLYYKMVRQRDVELG